MSLRFKKLVSTSNIFYLSQVETVHYHPSPPGTSCEENAATGERYDGTLSLIDLSREENIMYIIRKVEPLLIGAS
jgi:hypothetical protein